MLPTSIAGLCSQSQAKGLERERSHVCLVDIRSYDVISGEVPSLYHDGVPSGLFVQEEGECQPLRWVLDQYELERVRLLIKAPG